MVLGDRHRRPGQALDSAQQRDFLEVAQRKGDARPSGPGRAADAVHIIFGVLGQLVIDDVGDAFDVQSPGNDIRGHQNRHPALHEGLQRALALPLGLVGMDGSGLDAALLQHPHHPVGRVLGACKDERAARLI